MTDINMADGSITEKKAKIKLTYYFDALCGWCYGFSPVMAKINEKFRNEVEIDVISGGLFLGERRGTVNQVAPYIKQGAYKTVEAKTGVKFGEAFLKDIFEEEKIVLDSLPLAIALCIIKDESPNQTLEFAAMLLAAVYSDGLNPRDINGLADLATKIGFDKEEFKVKLSLEKYLKLTETDYNLFRESQFSGMPAVTLEREGQQILLSNGYASFEDLNQRLESILAISSH